ncbi:hypothetical protein CAPTEDRAFT_158045 [Capitella teleta]|uniref:Dynamin-type G domain-containing protein n=1 Tax=Capitella teleta TaxID=283909 RepID=R7USF1_CAPTE|nr:hypothetical protein CAPTEDRAFT_158045 [Capitella teleta]|eukprot:ELU09043.1 hypothetical protein CAPTEDRAFT_158045 [Capitella teleta]
MSGGMIRQFSETADASQGSRKLGNGRQSPTSPLKLFGQAKKKINDIFVEINGYVDESNGFLGGLDDKDDIISKDQKDKTQSYADKVKGIREILNRDRMKVAFFGRTSNGKSTVINAMLKSKILPSGIGHTTNCFVQVEGTDNQEGYIMQGDNQESVHSVKQLAHALCDAKLDVDTLIRVCWPKEKCSLLRDDVVLVDSPGIDVSADIDTWIDKFCLDADVFVLVANAESTLMVTEKSFFHRVSSRLSKPNIFILNNRWDASASEPEMMEEVRQQHMTRTVEFLVDELKVNKPAEAEDRVFFVSAREALISRSNEAAAATPNSHFLDGYQGRLFEFCSFERKFEECISQSAVQTKFAQHADNGKSITAELRQVMAEVCDSASDKRTNTQQLLEETRDRLDFVDKQLSLMETEIKDKIVTMAEDVEYKVSSALMDEIRRLALVVDEFDRPFSADPLFLGLYKRELHEHIEKMLGQNLQNKCSSALRTAVEGCEQEMTERLTSLLPEEGKQQVANLLPAHDFEVAYRLDCRNLCADFHEDIEFKFSLGITALMNRFLGPRGTKSVLLGYSDRIPRPMPSTPQTPSNESIVSSNQDNEVMLALLSTFTSLYSRTTVGALALTGLLAKAAGWRVIAVTGAVYGMVYVYERLMWTTKARERAFKRQYVDYASSKLKLIVDLTSANCSYQVQQELSSTLARLGRQVDISKDELKSEVDKLRTAVSKLDDVNTQAKILKNKAGYLDTEINSFMLQYLNPSSKI